jgi:nanoRNase/pAp phosphatase (c-di-AMP/oligoRNAs hydrolase)
MEPALKVNLSLSGEDGTEYCTTLLKLLKSETLEYVADLPEVRERSAHAESLIREGMRRFVTNSKLEPDGIVVYVVDSTDVIISRYAPYYIFPEARYSVGLVISPDGASIRAMRNPWREFPSLPLGEIFSRFGGGGHQRVGALRLPTERMAEARAILDRILFEIRREENKQIS